MTDNDTWYLAILCELRAISWAIEIGRAHV